MKCSNCGCEVNSESRFCENCGTPLPRDILLEENATKEIEEKVAVQLAKEDKITKSPAPRYSVPNNPVYAGKQKLKPGIKVSPKIILGILGAVAVIFMFCGITSLFKKLVTEKSVYAKGSGMVAVNGVICNNAGAINFEFKGEDYDFYTDTKGEIGVIRPDDNKVYLIDSDLSTTLITTGCDEICMNYTGEYIYFTTDNKSKHGEGLFVYDVKNKELRQLKADGYIYNMVSSPDGKTLLYSNYEGIKMIGVGGIETLISDEGFYTYAVSNDRKLAYFSDFDDKFSCWKDGEIIEIDNKELWGTVANSDCTKILYTTYDDSKKFINYFDSNTLESKKNIVKDFYHVYYRGNAINYFDPQFLSDADSFEGLIIEGSEDYCWLNKDMEAVHMDKCSDYFFSDTEFKVFSYDGDSIFLSSYGDGDCDTKKVYTSEAYIREYTVSDNAETLWISFSDKVIMYKNGVEETVLTVEKKSYNHFSLCNDPLTGGVYCIDPEGELYLLDEEKGAVPIMKLKKGDHFYNISHLSNGEDGMLIASEGYRKKKYYVYGHFIDYK